MKTLAHLADTELKTLETRHQRRRFFTANYQKEAVIYAGKPLISFASNDYFGLSQHEEVKEAAKQAIERHGAGSGAARLLGGNHPLYAELEIALAQMKGTEAALVFGSGYLANIGVIPALVGKDDLVIADKYIHACMVDGVKLSGAKLLRFAHNDMQQCAELLTKHRKSYRHCLLLTETIFSMDGDAAPLDALAALAKQHDAWLMTDDAHGLGIVPSHKGVDIQMGTLSKALGSYGGYVCASRKVIDYLTNTARSGIFTTALPPSCIAAALKALEIVENTPELRQNVLHKATTFCRKAGLPAPHSPIVPIILGEAKTAMKASESLKKKGFFVPAIRPPSVPKGTARLRLSFSALQKDENIAELAEVIRGYL